MDAPHILPAVDRRRCALLLRSCLDGGGSDAVAAVLDEANAAGQLPGLIVALLSGTLELLVHATGSVDDARAYCDLQLLNMQADSDD